MSAPIYTKGELELLPQSKFNTDYSFGGDCSKSVTGFAVKYHLSSYDASYRELAIRKDAVAGTLDDNLSKACAGLDRIF
jgi:predicted nucleic acid-binding protein